MLGCNARGLSGNALKLIACALMLIDHVGILLFPRDIIFRVIGRLAFPIFAFMIAEGARYTKNKLRYFLTILAEGLIIQVVYYVAMRDTSLSIFITFALAIPVIYALDLAKRALLSESRSLVRVTLTLALFVALVVGARVFCHFFDVDYGFYGVMTPVFASLFMLPPNAPECIRRFDTIPVHVAACGVALFLLSGMGTGVQAYSLLALPLLLLYSGRRGKMRLKYFFYVFYPAHMVAIYGVKLLLEALK